MESELHYDGCEMLMGTDWGVKAIMGCEFWVDWKSGCTMDWAIQADGDGDLDTEATTFTSFCTWFFKLLLSNSGLPFYKRYSDNSNSFHINIQQRYNSLTCCNLPLLAFHEHYCLPVLAFLLPILLRFNFFTISFIGYFTVSLGESHPKHRMFHRQHNTQCHMSYGMSYWCCSKVSARIYTNKYKKKKS